MTVLNRASGEPLRFVLAWPKLGSVTKVQHNTVLYIYVYIVQSGSGGEVYCVAQALLAKVCRFT